jgi:hypothetical protein
VTRRSAAALVLAAGLALASGGPAGAADWEVAPFAGVRFGGSFDDSSGAIVDFDPAPAFGITLGRSLARETRVELTWSRQQTALEERSIDLDVDHLHIAGVYAPRPTGGYVLASAGLTRFDSSLAGADTDVGFSLGIGGGARVPIDRRLSLRLEARGWAVLTSGGGGAVCSGGCVFFFSGSGLFQLEGSVGLAVAF